MSVVRLPVRTPDDEIDGWGRDPGAVRRLRWWARLRWQVDVDGAEQLPRRGALIVVNSRRLALAPVFTALAVGSRVDRPVLFVGRGDMAPLGPALQRVGAVQALPDEIAGALRAGALVVLGSAHRGDNARCGDIDPRLVGAAQVAGVPVVPAGTTSSAYSRQARVRIGSPIRAGTRRGRALQPDQLADLVRRRVDGLLDTATPSRAARASR